MQTIGSVRVNEGEEDDSRLGSMRSEGWREMAAEMAGDGVKVRGEGAAGSDTE